MENNKKADVTTFAERHPYLNFLVGLFLFLLLVLTFGYAVYEGVKCVFIGIRITIDWLSSLASKLESVIIVALITGIAHDSYRINITSIDAEHDISMREVYGLDKTLRE